MRPKPTRGVRRPVLKGDQLRLVLLVLEVLDSVDQVMLHGDGVAALLLRNGGCVRWTHVHLDTETTADSVQLTIGDITFTAHTPARPATPKELDNERKRLAGSAEEPHKQEARP